MNLFVGTCIEIDPAIVENDKSSGEAFNEFEGTIRVVDMLHNACEVVIRGMSKLVNRIKGFAVRIRFVPLVIVWCNDEGFLGGIMYDLAYKRRFTGTVGADNNDAFGLSYVLIILHR